MTDLVPVNTYYEMVDFTPRSIVVGGEDKDGIWLSRDQGHGPFFEVNIYRRRLVESLVVVRLFRSENQYKQV